MEFQNFEKFIQEYGSATAACMLGHRDTGTVKNWIKRGKIPKNQILQVEDMIDTVKTHPAKTVKEARKVH